MEHKTDFHALADRYMGMVYRLALSSVRHPADAEDITQNVMLRLLRAAPAFESEEHAKHWLIRVTVNETKRLLTSPWRWRTIPLEQLEAVLPADHKEQRELLRAVLSLPPKYRLPLYLYYYEGYAVGEISNMLGRKESTIQTQLARGRDKLKQILTEEDYNE